MITHFFSTWLILIATLLPVSHGAERITFYHLDLQQSPVAATDSNGEVIWREQYKPYGQRTIKENGGEGRLWYTGKAHEEGTNLSYYGARWYHPETGRFMAIDPVDFQEENIHSFNRYAYANNNPYGFIDPDGRSPVLAIFGGVVGGISGGFSASANGGNFTDIVVASGVGAVAGAISGATLGAVPSAPAAIMLSQFFRSAGTGAVSSAMGEVAGQTVTGKDLNTSKITGAALIGATAGMGGHLVAQMGFGARAGIATGGMIEFVSSPAKARADSLAINRNNKQENVLSSQ